MEDFYKKGHIFLESPKGRDDLFLLFKKEIEESLRGDQVSNAVAMLRILKSYIKGDSFAFINYDLPNVFSLRKKKDEIRKDALLFLKEIIETDQIKKVYTASNDASQKFDILYLLGKFMPEMKGLRLRHFADLYLLLLHTALFRDRFEGNESSLFDLGDLAVKVFARYDCQKAAEHFLLDPKLKGLLKEYFNKYPPYKEYTRILRDRVNKFKNSGFFDEEDFTPLIFTDRLFYILDNESEGLLKRALSENEAKLLAFINERCNQLFKDDERKEMIVRIDSIIKEKMKSLPSGEKELKSIHQMIDRSEEGGFIKSDVILSGRKGT